jgi:phage terminase Nu1 subunit (DNA packaging protein)
VVKEKNTRNNDEPQLFGAKAIAALLGKSGERIRQLSKEGVIPFVKVGALYKYDKEQVYQAYIAHLEGRLKDNAKSGEVADNKLSAEAKLKNAQAEIKELELAELKEQLLNAEDVKDLTSAIVFACREKMLSQPGRYSVDLAEICGVPKAVTKISDYLTKAIKVDLTELSELKFDAEAYRRRVRERKGWVNSDEQEDEEPTKPKQKAKPASKKKATT